ncbi:sugar transferase [Vannielia litorea]|uniref:Sugar transferase involved in LPS biosynthesis (Colanic, teichoic acid) n=1 Tax=Vannielia litorea TaxID=1217970 RepID=A0A1N6G641_9RHOB|nr:sugar transferase [Vannielia litorea]SIO02954.1 Sugar transferase involved in LPS biosynthesis (colanic, teichoic acid) [Vannielia litorea]
MKVAKLSNPNPVGVSPPGFVRGRKTYRRVGKRTLDILLALLLLPLISPVLLVLCAIARRDGGPSLYGHERVGQNGRRFQCWKIRSMVIDSERRLVEYLDANPEAAAEWHRDFKLRKDPRITAFGHFIRKTSLDELPQIWNVLRGDMSFVGPRPIVAEELKRYGNFRSAYLALRPGITGPWQVMGRNNICYADRVQLDVQYAQSMGLWSDLWLIARTAGVVLRSTGQ